MIDLDTTVVAFVKNNIITMTIAVIGFKGIAKVTKWKWDDTLANTMESILSVVKRGKGNNETLKK